MWLLSISVRINLLPEDIWDLHIVFKFESRCLLLEISEIIYSLSIFFGFCHLFPQIGVLNISNIRL